jgi:hypothetical protein
MKNKQINTTNKIAIIRQKAKLNPKKSLWSRHSVAPDIAAALNISLERMDFWRPVLLGENIMFKESPHSIMVTKKPNWSTEILWYEIGYVKGKILSPFKRFA